LKVTFSNLWRPVGTVNRGTYALVGAIGFALKHNLDRFVATYFFHRHWSLSNYWVPVRDVARMTDLRGHEAKFLAVMVALALPFIWLGVVLTLKRLRSAQLPASLVALFFFPFVNLAFFLLLCMIPERTTPDGAKMLYRGSVLQRFIPESAFGSAAISLLLTVPLGIALVLTGVQVFTTYGWGLFIALPFTMGFTAAVVYSARQPRSLPSCVTVACASIAIMGVALLAFAIEGVICLMMAVPIAVPLAALGGMCGYLAQRWRWAGANPAFLSAVLLFVPGVQWLEHGVRQAPPTFVVRSAININAPPESVWKQVVAFSEIPSPTELIFRAGVAYPVRAVIFGSGPGAERHCVFSTGAFVEPIQIWDEPRTLKFSVTSNPAPMQEWTPYAHLDPPHLHGFLLSNGGQFSLTPLPNGGTRLEGTTWYHHGLWPAIYWRWWSDAIIHRIHMRVLIHIRDEAEKGAVARGHR
jgi:hypothetical protein